MIYFVDEDVSQISQWASILRMKGMQTCVLRDADTALEHLSQCDDIELVFIDVMLAAAPDTQNRIFTRAQTDDYHSTGVELLKALVERQPRFFPSYAIFLSQAGQSMILEKVKLTVQEFRNEVLFWQKGSFASVKDFAAKTEEEIKRRTKSKNS